MLKGSILLFVRLFVALADPTAEVPRPTAERTNRSRAEQQRVTATLVSGARVVPGLHRGPAGTPDG